MTSRDEQELQRAGEMRREAERLLGESEKILRRIVPRLVKRGKPITEIARTGHISRPTIYKMLRD